MAKGRTKHEPAVWHLEDPGPPDGTYVALAPGAAVPLLPLDLPGKLTGLARERVAHRLLSEQLALPLDGLEIRPWRRKGAAWDRAVVAEAADLAEWRKRLTGDCVGLLPDFLALPCIPGVWTVAVDAVVRARLGETDGFTAEPQLAAAMLADVPAPAAVLRLGEPDAAVDAAIAARGVPVFTDFAALADAGHGRPLPWAQAVQGLDLASPPSDGFDRIRAGLRRWSVPAVAAALAVAIWLVGISVQTGRLDARAAKARADTDAMVRAHFVSSGPILDVRAQVSAALAQVAPPPPPETDPLILFQIAAPVLAGGGVTLQAVSYQRNGGLVTAVNLPDFAALDRLTSDLRAQGFAVEELDSAARQEGGVNARLRLAEAGL